MSNLIDLDQYRNMKKFKECEKRWNREKILADYGIREKETKSLQQSLDKIASNIENIERLQRQLKELESKVTGYTGLEG